MMPQKGDYGVNLDWLTSQFNNSEFVRSFLESVLIELDYTNTSFFQLLNERGIDLAYGDRLDQLGKLIAVSRQGDQDATYKQRILNKILTKRGEATPNDILSIMKINTQADATDIWEHFPACVFFMSDGVVNKDTPLLLKNVSPAGVDSQYVIWNEYAEAHIPVEVGAPSSQYLPEYNEDASYLVIRDGEEVHLNTGLFNEKMSVDTEDGSGRLLISSTGGNYTAYQGIFPDIFTIDGRGV